MPDQWAGFEKDVQRKGEVESSEQLHQMDRAIMEDKDVSIRRGKWRTEICLKKRIRCLPALRVRNDRSETKKGHRRWRERRTKMIQLRRVYDPASPNNGARFLVERLWLRGVKKASLHLDGWLKEVGPSHALRRWFSHDPAKWEEFRRRYLAELDANPKAWQPLLQAARKGSVELLYSSRDTEHNNAVALRDYLESKVQGKARPA